MTTSAETRSSFRTLPRWTLDQACPYSAVMKHNKPDMRETVRDVVRAVGAAGPVGWMALVTCAALALAGYAIWAILTIVDTLGG